MALAGGIGAWTASCLSDNRAVHSLVRRGWPAARARRDGILAEYLLPLPMRREGEPVRPSVPPAAAPVWSAVPAQTVVSAQPAVPAQTVVVSAQPAVPERPAVPARPVGSPRQPAVPAQPVGSPSQPAVPVHPAVAALSAWSGGLAAAPGSSPLPGLAAMVAALSALSGRDDGNLERSPGVATARRM
jgi:hypothetical protein